MSDALYNLNIDDQYDNVDIAPNHLEASRTVLVV